MTGDPTRDDLMRLLAAAGTDGADVELERAIGAAYRRLKRRAKAGRDAAGRAHDRSILAQATRFREETGDPSLAGSAVQSGTAVLRRPRRCYVCKQQYREADADYHLLCRPCAQDNRSHRAARCDLHGRRALVTGGRIKIGFQTALKLLRDGAEVLVTTRFPRDAARRFAAVADADDWSRRLRISGVDLLHLDQVQQLIAQVGADWGRLDILINNAAQTLHRPPGYYAEVSRAERDELSGIAASIALSGTEPGGALFGAPEDIALSGRDGTRVGRPPAVSEALPGWDASFPVGCLDETGQPLDLRQVNSWTHTDGDVTPQEWLQVHVINAFAPFLLTSRLRPFMCASPFADRYVVQVSAMEGNYSRQAKTIRHPHTNMAKAALNMLTRTVAADYARDGIHMNSVDTGWVTDERPHPQKTAQRAAGFRPPLDVVDGAARVYDPIVRGVTGTPVHGLFLKDYRSSPW